MSPRIRSAAVAGLFYEADPAALERGVKAYLAAAPSPRREPGTWWALLLPHAGHVFSGRIAGAAAGSVEWPRTVILLGPNHTGAGAPAALSPSQAWRTPLGEVRLSRTVCEDLLAASSSIVLDEDAHADEHSLEVLLPFLQLCRPDVEIACLSLGERDLPLCLEVGAAVASVVTKAAERGETVALVVSSDLNHYLPRPRNTAKDDRAIEALLSGDPRELFERVLVREAISMCGVLPATALLEALRKLGGASAEVLARGDSSDFNGDDARVVGYASIVFKREAS